MKSTFTAVALVTLLLLAIPSRSWPAARVKILHSFGAASDGNLPYDTPILDSHGNLYGVTFGGGTTQCGNVGCGTVYELVHEPKERWKEVVLHNFAGHSDGASPQGNLVFDAVGRLYGTLAGAGPGQTALFALTQASDGWTNALIYTGPTGPGLLLDGLGNLYGEMGRGQYGYSAIAELSPNSNGWDYTALYSFCSPHGVCPEGYDFAGPPTWDGKANMFGTTPYGGIGQPECWISFGCGVIFEMTPNGDGTWTYHVLHRFASSKTDGQTPSSGLVMDASGNFYGTTGLSGPNGNGIVFKLGPKAGGGWKMRVIYDFPNCHNGCGPGGDLAFDQAGNLYGAAGGGNTACGGDGEFCGMIYKLTPQKNGTWKYSSVYKFHGPDGWGPNGVTLDGKGHIYGTTVNGGAYNWGVAFEITP